MARNVRTHLYSQTVEAPFAFGSEFDLPDADKEAAPKLIDGSPSSSVAALESSSKSQAAAIQMIIYLVGFSEGLTHLAALAIYYLVKDDLGLGPSGTAALFIIPALPWFLKPGLAFLSDTCPIWGMRRKPYLIIFSLLEALGYLILAEWPSSLWSVPGALLVIAVGAACCSAISEALVVESSNLPHLLPQHAASAASTSVSELIGAKAIGSLVVAYLSGALLEMYSKRWIFRATALFPLLITVGACVMRDTGEAPLISVAEQISILKAFLRQRVIWGPACFILLFMGGPDYDDALFFFYTNELGFSPSFMGSLRFTYGVAALMGLFIYNAFLQRTSYRAVLLYTILVALPIYLSPLLLVSGRNRELGISDEVFVLSGGFLIEAVAELQLLPLLVFTTLICPPGLEGSVYSIMMSLRNLGSAIGKLSSAVAIKAFGITAYNFDKVGDLIWVCGSFTLVPLLTLGLIPTAEEMQDLRAQNLQARNSSKPPPMLRDTAAPDPASVSPAQIWQMVTERVRRSGTEGVAASSSSSSPTNGI